MFNQYKDFDAKNIFKTFRGHIAYDGRLNGLDVFIMQSDENLQKVLYTAEDYMQYTDDRVNAMDFALKLHRLNETLDFTDVDRKRIRDWVKHG